MSSSVLRCTLRSWRCFGLLAMALASVDVASAASTPTGSAPSEAYTPVPMPPGFQVVATELEGPVFADEHGKTLYIWPYHMSTGTNAGDVRDTSVCGDHVVTVSAGAASPYPAGLTLPDLDNRRSCAAVWPPVVAGIDAKRIGRWSIITRAGGGRQWAYDRLPLYTSILDHAPGDTFGGTAMSIKAGGIPPGINAPSSRLPATPPSAVPPGFRVSTTQRGRMLVTEAGYTIYASDSDGPDQSRCLDACAQRWRPLLAAESAKPQGEWSAIERAPGVRQWAFRKQPLYAFTEDPDIGVSDGNDVPGWHSVYAQLAPSPPRGFSVQASVTGDVLADDRGRTVYIYSCIDDSDDQVACDTLDSPQGYRLAVCGDGDAARCQSVWPYVTASADARSDSRIWSAVWVDPATGRRAQPAQPGALHVWAFRDRPIYTYSGDREPGDTEGHATGEEHGWWNGYKAFWLGNQFDERGGVPAARE